MKVKFITCIYSDLYGTEYGGRENRRDHYRFSLLSLLKMTNADFVCYTSEREYDELVELFNKQYNFPKEKIEFKIHNLGNTKYKDLINKYKDITSVMKSDRCYEIQYSKFDWFRNETGDYDYYYWVDSGLSHTGIIPNKYLDGPGYRTYFESKLFNNDFLFNLIKLSEDKFVVIGKENVRNFWDRPVDAKYYNNFDMSYHIIGGLFGGKKSLWDNIVTKFDNYLELVTNDSERLFYEEHIMSLMYYNDKDLFKLLTFDVWWHEDNYKEHPKNFFIENKSFYKILEGLNE